MIDSAMHANPCCNPTAMHATPCNPTHGAAQFANDPERLDAEYALCMGSRAKYPWAVGHGEGHGCLIAMPRRPGALGPWGLQPQPQQNIDWQAPSWGHARVSVGFFTLSRLQQGTPFCSQ
jgi:hypothetical protein